MTKTVQLAILSAAALLMVAACNKETGKDSGADAKYITVQASIAQTKVAVSGNSSFFETGDAISLYAWTGSDAVVADEKVVDGVVNTLQGDGSWTPAVQMKWADMVTPHYFIGLYPTRTVSDFKADPFTVDNTDYVASDLLVARNLAGLKATQNPVSLTFDHAMAKLLVNLNFRNQWDETPAITSCEATAAGSCTIDYLAGTYAVAGQSAVALTAKEAAEGYARSFSGIMIPQQGFRSVTITIAGQAYVYTHTEDIALEAGKYTILNLIVGRNKIEIGEVSINDWTEGTTLSGGQALQ
ncbi:MAG: fimbrillin family protein [Bacteroidales bacterium]|nr:fimbrillin family protein [Bacteroidales bacterium]